MRISGIFNNNFLISSTGINSKQKVNNTKHRTDKAFQPQNQNGGTDVFVKNERIRRLYHKNGNISLEAIYKDGAPYKDTWYDFNGKAQRVRYYDESLNLSRNAWHDWKKAPMIELEQNTDGKTIRLHAEPAVLAKGDSKGKTGGYNLSIRDKDGHSIQSNLYANPDGTFSDYDDENLQELKTALVDLLGLISSDKYRDGFGGSYKFNNGVKNAIKYIESKE